MISRKKRYILLAVSVVLLWWLLLWVVYSVEFLEFAKNQTILTILWAFGIGGTSYLPYVIWRIWWGTGPGKVIYEDPDIVRKMREKNK